MLIRSRNLLAAVVVALGLAACSDLTTPEPGPGKIKGPNKPPDSQVQAPAGTSAAG